MIFLNKNYIMFETNRLKNNTFKKKITFLYISRFEIIQYIRNY